MVQATVWNKALAATVGDHQSKMVSLAEVKRNSAGPPNDEMGERILDAYFLRTHHRYPFLDRQDVMELHANRMATTRPNTPSEQFGTFKLNMIYAIGATLLKLTGPVSISRYKSTKFNIMHTNQLLSVRLYSTGIILHDCSTVYICC